MRETSNGAEVTVTVVVGARKVVAGKEAKSATVKRTSSGNGV